MATHSSILAWRIPWTEEPGGVQSTGSQSDTTEQLTFSLFIVILQWRGHERLTSKGGDTEARRKYSINNSYHY